MDNAHLQERLKDIDTLLHGVLKDTNSFQALDGLPVEHVVSVHSNIASLKAMRATLAREIYKQPR